MANAHDVSGPDRERGLSRREFVKGVGAAALAGSAVPLIGSSAAAGDKVGPSPSDAAETAVARFYKTLKDDQKSLICFPFDHAKRSQIQNNWAIVQPTIDDLKPEQQELCREIMKNLCSEEGYERFMRQMDEDYGGFEQYHVAVFGEPGNGQPFEWVVTGRHDTLRADGNSVDGVAFGGPIFYGHDATGTGNDDANHTGNVWWYQGRQANAIYQTLDEAQRTQALVEMGKPADSPRVIQLKGPEVSNVPGLAVAELDDQQKQMVKALLKDMLSPFRKVDVEEVRACLEAAGGLDTLRLTYYKEGDIGDDGVWDIWKLEGPAFSWYFHGAPHVHTWLHVAHPA